VTLRISLLFSASFLLLLIIGDYFKVGAPDLNENPVTNFAKLIYFIGIFSSFTFGLGSSMLSMSLRSSLRKGEDITYVKENPIIWLLTWREVKDEIKRI
jgi:hypothetical protein